jgi:hypothetical protein
MGALLCCLMLGMPPVAADTPQVDSLLGAAQRLAQAWTRHDFAALTRGSGDVLLLLPGAAAASALRAEQAAELLRGYTDGVSEISIEVVVARDVDSDRAYVEVQRVFTVRGTSERRFQTVYFGLRRQGGGYRLYEVRIVA